MLTRKELLEKGLIDNPHGWIGSGWMFCPNCKDYRFHYAMSYRDRPYVFPVCRGCDNYCGSTILLENK